MYFSFQNWASLMTLFLGNLFKAVMENFVQNLTVILVKGIDFGQCLPLVTQDFLWQLCFQGHISTCGDFISAVFMDFNQFFTAVAFALVWYRMKSFFFFSFLLVFSYSLQVLDSMVFPIFFFKFYFIFKLYSIVLVLPNIEMNPAQVQMTFWISLQVTHSQKTRSYEQNLTVRLWKQSRKVEEGKRIKAIN